MNNQPTPETDAIVRNAATADHPPTRLAAMLTVKCEKLERERDEARGQRDMLAAALRIIADGTSCRECGGEDQALLAREALQTLTPNEQ